MKKNKDVIGEVMKGNGNGYTVKELLNAHIKDGKKFENYVRERFEKGTGKIAENRAKVNAIANVLKFGIAPIIVGVVIAVAIKFFP